MSIGIDIVCGNEIITFGEVDYQTKHGEGDVTEVFVSNVGDKKEVLDSIPALREKAVSVFLENRPDLSEEDLEIFSTDAIELPNTKVVIFNREFVARVCVSIKR